MATAQITARIYWDDQDQRTVGWAWATQVDGEHDDTGPLGAKYPAGSPELDDLQSIADDDLIAMFRREVTEAAEVEVVR